MTEFCVKLLNDENFQLNEKVSDATLNNDEIDLKYVKGEVRIVTEQARYPLQTVKDLFVDSNYILQPQFQRRKRWPIGKKSKLIESFIINVPIPPVFLYEIDYANFEVMDGLQRISTIIDFYQDKFQLTDLDEWPELNGMTYSKLPQKVKEGINRRYLSSIILLNESAKDEKSADKMKKMVFERLNSGGVKLAPQEIRNALYDGKMNQLTLKLSQNNSFRKLWDIEIPTHTNDEEDTFDIDELPLENSMYQKMQDVELILRFFAMRHNKHFTKRLDDFLDQFLIISNEWSEDVLSSLENLFTTTITKADELFGDKAFKLLKKSGRTTKAHRMIYDPMMLALSNYICEKGDFNTNLTSPDCIEELQKFYEENSTIFNGKKQTKAEINERTIAIDKFLKSIVES